jgi:hypothetical protein
MVTVFAASCGGAAGACAQAPKPGQAHPASHTHPFSALARWSLGPDPRIDFSRWGVRPEPQRFLFERGL